MQQITADDPSPMQAARLRRGLSLRALATACEQAGTKVSNSQLSKIERGLFAPQPELRAVLARLLELDAVEDFPRRTPIPATAETPAVAAAVPAQATAGDPA